MRHTLVLAACLSLAPLVASAQTPRMYTPDTPVRPDEMTLLNTTVTAIDRPARTITVRVDKRQDGVVDRGRTDTFPFDPSVLASLAEIKVGSEVLLTLRGRTVVGAKKSIPSASTRTAPPPAAPAAIRPAAAVPAPTVAAPAEPAAVPAPTVAAPAEPAPVGPAEVVGGGTVSSPSPPAPVGTPFPTPQPVATPKPVGTPRPVGTPVPVGTPKPVGTPPPVVLPTEAPPTPAPTPTPTPSPRP